MMGENRKVRLDGITYTAKEVAAHLHVPVRHVCAVLDKIKHAPITPTWAMFHVAPKDSRHGR